MRWSRDELSQPRDTGATITGGQGLACWDQATGPQLFRQVKRSGLGSGLLCPSVTSGHSTSEPSPVHTGKAALGVEGWALVGQDNQTLHHTLLPSLCGPGKLQQEPGCSDRA